MVKYKHAGVVYYFENEQYLKKALDRQAGGRISDLQLMEMASIAVCGNSFLKCRLSLEDLLDRLV